MSERTRTGATFVVRGEGLPVTVLVHGIAGSRDDCLSLAAGLPGTRVLLSLRGHDDAEAIPATGWTWDTYSDDIRSAVEQTGAEHAVGVSAGAAAMLHLMAAEPDLLRSAAVLLPAVVDTPRGDDATSRLAELGPLIEAGDTAAIAAHLLAELPAAIAEQRAAGIWALRRARLLTARTPPWPAEGLGAPLASMAELDAVTADLLLVAQEDDGLHPVDVARRLAAALPHAHLEVLAPAGVFWTARERVADLLAQSVSGCLTQTLGST